jgi:DNA-binding NtrC family response regulator
MYQESIKGKETRNKILLVGEELRKDHALQAALGCSFEVFSAANSGDAVACLLEHLVDVVLLDVLLPDADGIQLLDKLKRIHPALEVIVVTEVLEIQTAVRAIKAGAFEYMTRPFEVHDLHDLIHRALKKSPAGPKEMSPGNKNRGSQPFEEMVGQDERMQEVFQYIVTIARSNGAVLIQGESGTGKELVARAIHSRSTRWDKPFSVVNCAAVPQTLMERELFGHNRGAFTGAVRTLPGKMERADKGTVFLDDIDSLDVHLQAKLLRFIQEKEFERLGSTCVTRVDVRFVAACNRSLHHMISNGTFREDLYFRLNVFPIRLPPLRKRRKDIPLLAKHFLNRYRKAHGAGPKRFTKGACQLLMEYDWPGNVRELENLVLRICTLTRKQTIQRGDIPLDAQVSSIPMRDCSLKEAVKAFERRYIGSVLDSVNGSRKEAAKRLGIHRNTLLSKIGDLGL